MPPIINKEKCTGCMTCVTICPMDCFGVAEQEEGAKYPVVNFPDECWHCNGCVEDCPADACSIRVPMPLNMVFTEAPKKG